MPGRRFTAETGYRYGFNGKEKGPETKATKEENLNPVNLDWLLAMMGAVAKQPTPPEIDGMTPAEFTKTIQEVSETIKEAIPEEKKDEIMKPDPVIRSKTRPAKWYWSNENGGSSEMPGTDIIRKKSNNQTDPDTSFADE